MNVKLIIKTSDAKKTMVKVRFRLLDGRRNDLFIKSDIKVDIRFWDFERECYKNIKACPYTLAEQTQIKNLIANHKMLIEKVYLKLKHKEDLTSKYMNECVQNYLKYGNDTAMNMDLMVNLMKFYLQEKKFSIPKIKSFNTLIQSVIRFENFISFIQKSEVKIFMSDVNHQLLRDYRKFLHNEISYISKYPELYADKTISSRLKVRTENYVEELLIRLRSFWNWCINEGKVSHNPFVKFDIEPPVYGEPIVMTDIEKEILVNATIQDSDLDLARDYMVFCNNVGCRPSEATKLSKTNFVTKEENGVITKNVVYYQRKGARKRITKIDNPLNQVALNVVNKYYFLAGDSLLPKLNLNKYNKDLKKLFKLLGLTREVLIYDRRTGEERIQTLDTLVTAHMGRRNFLSAVANSGADKAIYTKMSGHQINTVHLERYIYATNESKKKVVDRICPVIEDKYESNYFQRSIS